MASSSTKSSSSKGDVLSGGGVSLNVTFKDSSTLTHELAFKEAQLDEERFLKQKAKVEWLKAGAFVAHYDQFLGTEGITNPLDDHDHFIRVLDTAKAVYMKAWDVVGAISLVLFGTFVSNGKLLKERNHTTIALIPKVLVFTLRWSNGLWYVFLVPLTLYALMATCMVILRVNECRVRNSDEFQYHHHCEHQRIINLCFADDLFLFARGHPNLVSVIMDTLEEFKQVSGLVPSIPKSTDVFCNVLNAIKASILNSMPFAKGALSVRYMGVLLISTRLLYHDYKILVEKLESRINDWRNKFLSLAGRLQLIRSVLSSMHIYWASVFILPTCIMHDLEQLMRGFIWCQREMKKGKAKVTWDSMCMPKHVGGLGISRIDDFNVALMATHIWSILTHRESLWVKWVHTYKLKGRSLWDVPCRGDVSWGWHMLSNRDITRLGFSLNDSVSDLISDGVWRWLLDWLSGFLFMAQLQVPLADMVNWYIVVWFPQCILRHSIHLWLVVQQKLKTQDRLRQWDVGPSIDLNLLRCPLSDLVPDSHDHLFFECSFSTYVWSKVRVLCKMDVISPRLINVIAFIILISKGKTIVSILSRIVVAATSYYIWLERNGRLFKKKTSSPDHIVQVILSMVRLKLVTFKFKKMSTRSCLLLDQ
ncbi:putative gag-pol polyprotein [Tanacetum coccineum]